MVLGSLLEDLGGVVLMVLCLRTWGMGGGSCGSLLEGTCRITSPDLIVLLCFVIQLISLFVVPL